MDTDNKINQEYFLDKEQMAAALACIGDGIILTDMSGNIDFMNYAAEALTGWSLDTVRGIHFNKIIQLINTYTGDPMESPVDAVLQSGIATGLQRRSALISKNGEKKYISAIWSPIKKTQDSISGIVLVFRDITKIILMEKNLRQERDKLKKSEKKSRKSRDLYLGILERFPSIIFRTNSRHSIIYASRRWSEFTGIQIKKDIRYDLIKLVHPEDIEAAKNIYLKAFELKKPYEMELRLKHKSGNYRWLFYMVRPFYGIYGNFEGCVAVMVDIDNIKKNNEVSKQYQLLSTIGRDIILFMDEKGKIIDANEAAVKAYGYTRKELLNLDIFSIRKSISPTYDQIKQAFTAGLSLETVHYRKDGSFFPVEINSQGVNIDNRCILLSVIRDISERKLATEALSQSEARFKSLFMNLKSALSYNKIILDSNGIPIDFEFIEVNEAFSELLCHKKEQIIGKRFSELLKIDEKKFKDAINNFGKIALDGTTVIEDDYYININNKWYRRLVYSPEKYYFITIMNDLTEKKNIISELQKSKEIAEVANKAKSEFLTNMSHELRTPLNGITGMLDLTLSTDITDEQSGYLKKAQKCTKTLIKIINDVLDFSKIEVGKLKIEKVPFNIMEVVEEVFNLHSPYAAKKGVEINLKYPPTIEKVLLGDPGRLQQILNNLIGNAVKFTENGEVCLEITKFSNNKDSRKLQFAIIDTGIGISEDEQDKLFKSFSQLDGSLSRKYEGTGLGLVISKNLVEMMGGTIWFESKKDIGSTFSFTIEFGIAKEKKETTPNAVKINKAPIPLHILVVEDNEINKEVTTLMLEKRGYIVNAVSSGNEALNLLKCGCYDLVLMDIEMSEIDGIETTAELRKMEAVTKHHTPVIATTAYKFHGDRERFLLLGMDEYISKPFQMNELFNLIDKVTLKEHLGEMPYKDLRVDKNGEFVLAQTEDIIIKPEDLAIIEQLELAIDRISSLDISHNLRLIEKEAHDIKFQANKMAADSVKNLAFKIELTARRSDISKIPLLISKLTYEFRKFKKINRISQET
jgi:PAS domain S-box